MPRNADSWDDEVITIESLTYKDGRYSLKGTNGRSYSFFQKLSDGETDSKAATQFNEMDLDVGSTCGIKYDTAQKGDRTYRNIKVFYKARATEEPAPRKFAKQNPPVTVAPTKTWERNSEDEVIGKTACQFLMAEIQKHGLDTIDKAKVRKAVTTAEDLLHASKSEVRAEQKTAAPRKSQAKSYKSEDDEYDEAEVDDDDDESEDDDREPPPF